MNFSDLSGNILHSPLYQIKIGFSSAADLNAYQQDIDDFKVWRAKKSIPKKVGDRRGAHVKDMHARAREFHEMNPSMTYRESLKIVCRRDEDSDSETEV
jgi:hypothetical protein